MNENSELINRWIYHADHDLETAKIVFHNLPDYYDIIAFHCQQAVEKYIKSLLTKFNSDYKRTHDLVYLLDILSNNLEIPENLINEVIKMEGFGVQIRYPNQLLFLSKEELADIIKTTELFREFTLQNLYS